MPEINDNNKRKYIVTVSFTALKGGDGYAEEEIEVREQEHVFADIDAWKGVVWNGREIIAFLLHATKFYAQREVFMSSTALAQEQSHND